MPKSAAQTSAAPASKVSINLLDKQYLISCDPGEERHLQEIVKFVDGKLRDVAGQAGGNATESRLFMLTCLMLADELMETKRAGLNKSRAEEDLLVAAVDHLRQRVATIAQQVGRA